jgi:hypothetical protein
LPYSSHLITRYEEEVAASLEIWARNMHSPLCMERGERVGGPYHYDGVSKSCVGGMLDIRRCVCDSCLMLFICWGALCLSGGWSP